MEQMNLPWKSMSKSFDFKIELNKILSNSNLMNTSLFCLSLKYVNKKYKLISNVSKWIYFDLEKYNYKESKFTRSLDKKDLKIAKVLIKFNENINLVSKYLINNNLYRDNCFDFVKLLIDNGANVHLEDDLVLKDACRYGHLDTVKLLIDNGANIHIQDDFVLKLTSADGRFEIVKLLIENGANVNAENDDALMYASNNGHFEIVKLLIDNGANVHAENNRALSCASYYNHSDIVKLLIDNGALYENPLDI